MLVVEDKRHKGNNYAAIVMARIAVKVMFFTETMVDGQPEAGPAPP